MSQLTDTTREFRNTRVTVRFILRMVILGVFAMLGSIGFAMSLVALLWMSAVMCIVVGIVRRERVFDSALTHWDEAAAYGSLCCLASALIYAPAP
jgi:NADH:ubiquinone oxidoreductase subunit 2 (subunit N)